MQDIVAQAELQATLRDCRLFRHMRADERAEIGARARLNRYARGQQVVAVDTRGDDIFVVVTGTLLANLFSREGREIGYRQLVPGGYFGELAAIDGAPRSANVFALSDATVARLPAAAVQTLLAESPGFVRALLEDLAGMVRTLSNQLFAARAVPAAGRVQMELLRLALAGGSADDPAPINAPTHADFAVLVGAQREVVTRELSRLEAAGLIQRPRRGEILVQVRALVAEIERSGDATLEMR